MTHHRTALSSATLRRRIEPAAPRHDAPAGSAADRQGRVDRGVLAAWWLLLLVGTFLEPAADGAQPEVLGALDVALTVGGLTVMFAVTAMLARSGGGASGGWAAFGGGLFFLGLSLACPATSHHAVAGWWYGQLAASAGMALAGLVAVRHALRRR